MKRFVGIVVIPILLFSCAKEQGPVEEQVLPPAKELTVSLGCTARTSLLQPSAGVYPAVWCEGDRISANGVISRPVPSSEAGTDKVVFKFDDDISLPFNIIYPATESTDMVRFDSVQPYSEGTFSSGVAPMYGTTGTFADISLHHLSSVLRFPVRIEPGSSATITKVIVSSLGAEALSGQFQLAMSEDGQFSGEMSPKNTGSSSVALDCGQGVELSSGKAVDFYVCIPKGSYKKGFKAVFADDGGRAMNLFFLTDSETEIAGGKVMEFPEKVFMPDQSVFVIANEADLREFATDASRYDRVQMLADITMSATSGWTPVSGFTGEFDGANHVINGLKAPLFNILDGATVRNLVLNSDLSDYKAGPLAPLAVELAGKGRLVNCHTEGSFAADLGTSVTRSSGLVATLNGAEARITGCSSSADMEFSFNSTSSVYSGGIVAYAAAGTVEDCHFSGNLLLSGTSKNLFYGGIGGRCQEDFHIRGCFNEGNVSLGEDYTLTSLGFLGGVAGFITSDISDCHNSGTVLCSGASLTSINTGGVAGTARGGASACYNGGTVVCSVNKLPTYANIGGVLGTVDGSATSLEISSLSSLEQASVVINAPSSAQTVSAGGILGSANIASLEVTECTNNGTVKAVGAMPAYKVGLLLGGVIGSSLKASETSLGIRRCLNNGQVRLEETESSSNLVYAGGIIGLAVSGDKSKTLTLSVSDCSNSGDLTRFVSDMVYKSGDKTFCGGICGAIGGDNRAHGTYDYVNAEISNCSNSGTLVFNRYCGDGDFREPIINESYTGGIAGVSNSNNGTATTIRCCSNSGTILSNAGYNGGIVGFVYSGTRICGEKTAGGVVFCRNSGRIGIVNPDDYAETGSGYMLAGGICACLNSVNSNNTLEYCFNEGYVAASSDGKVGAGGIVADLRLSDVVSHCKNSGTVRFLPSSSVKVSSASATGQISGKSADFRVRFCAVGGRYGRKGNPTAGLDNLGGDERYLFSKFIYALTSDITTQGQIDSYAPGCTWWDGVTAPVWETE